MAKKSANAFLKKIPTGKALEALHKITKVVGQGKYDEALELLQNEYQIGPDTKYGTRDRIFLFLLRDTFLEGVEHFGGAKARENGLIFLQKYIESGVDVNYQDSYGYTLLHLAAYDGLPELCRVLVDCGARMDIEDNFGTIPLEEAMNQCEDNYDRNYGKCVSIFLLAGSDPNRPSGVPEGFRSPLDFVLNGVKRSEPEDPEDDILWKAFFRAYDKVKERDDSQSN